METIPYFYYLDSPVMTMPVGDNAKQPVKDGISFFDKLDFLISSNGASKRLQESTSICRNKTEDSIITRYKSGKNTEGIIFVIPTVNPATIVVSMNKSQKQISVKGNQFTGGFYKHLPNKELDHIINADSDLRFVRESISFKNVNGILNIEVSTEKDNQFSIVKNNYHYSGAVVIPSKPFQQNVTQSTMNCFNNHIKNTIGNDNKNVILSNPFGNGRNLWCGDRPFLPNYGEKNYTFFTPKTTSLFPFTRTNQSVVYETPNGYFDSLRETATSKDVENHMEKKIEQSIKDCNLCDFLKPNNMSQPILDSKLPKSQSDSVLFKTTTQEIKEEVKPPLPPKPISAELKIKNSVPLSIQVDGRIFDSSPLGDSFLENGEEDNTPFLSDS